MLFNVTYEIVTPESAEYGDADERGFILQDVCLRDAVEALHGTRTNRVDGVEAIEANTLPIDWARSVTVINGMEYETGAQESRALHFPPSLTPSSARRIFRLLGACK